jgi:hypothetical protein
MIFFMSRFFLLVRSKGQDSPRHAAVGSRSSGNPTPQRRERVCITFGDTISRSQFRVGDLAAQDRDLMTQHDDLEILEPPGTEPQHNQLQGPA